MRELPEAPVIVATELDDARTLLDDNTLTWKSGHAVCLDLALRSRRGDEFVVVDLRGDRVGRALHRLGPLARPQRRGADPGADADPAPGESAPTRPPSGCKALLDATFTGWRERETWRRRQVMEGRTGGLDMPGQTWRDRPAIDRGDGVFVAGDMVAAPGVLSEIAWASAVQASRLAVAAPLAQPRPAAA